jgi:High-affinity nickel-transport protein
MRSQRDADDSRFCDSLVALGFVLGLRHAIEADHLAAISTIVTERRSLLSSLLVGASWGLGHTLALLLAGVGVLLLRYQISDGHDHATVASHSHSEAWLVARPLLVGMVHGLAGSAPLLLLTLAVGPCAVSLGRSASRLVSLSCMKTAY